MPRPDTTANPYRIPQAHLGPGEERVHESVAVKLLRWLNRIYLVFCGFVLVFLFALMNVPLDWNGRLVLVNLALPSAAYIVASAGLRRLRLPVLGLLLANLGWNFYRISQDLLQSGRVESVGWVLTSLLMVGLLNLRVFDGPRQRTAMTTKPV